MLKDVIESQMAQSVSIEYTAKHYILNYNVLLSLHASGTNLTRRAAAVRNGGTLRRMRYDCVATSIVPRT